MATQHISPALFDFLCELKSNNDRSWFARNKSRYDRDVRGPMLDFIAAFGEPLAGISPHFRADPRSNGGSLFRIYRDTRFSRDKTPYKTNVGAHFRHEAGKDAHAPGFYLHLEPGICFAGCGVWHPASAALANIRNAIAAHPEEWKRITTAKDFCSVFDLTGSSLKRPPRGFEPDHPLIEDLKRKDFVAIAEFSDTEACDDGFFDRFAAIARSGAGFVEFLARAVGAPF